jgi:hypothetical protein
MKVRVSDSLKGELYVGCLDISLKKGQILDINEDKASHSDIIWALNKGYLNFLDVEKSKIMDGKVEIKNITNKTIIMPDTNKALSPGGTLFVDSSLFNTQGYIYLMDKNLISKTNKEELKEEKSAVVKNKNIKSVKLNIDKKEISEDISEDVSEGVPEDGVKVIQSKRKKAYSKPYVPSKLKETSKKQDNLPQNTEVTINGENKQ